MTEQSPATADSPQLFAYLKGQTFHSHRRLESRLALLKPPLLRERFVQVLRRFASFHRAWEPAMAAFPLFGEVMATRSRTGYAVRDLLSLGAPHSAMGLLEDCPLSGEMLADEAHAMGSLYVMEGSTLGGAVIGREVAKQAWAPAGLLYFTPPGRDARQDWLDLQRWSDHTWNTASWAAIAAGAQRTFEFLDDWLTRGALE